MVQGLITGKKILIVDDEPDVLDMLEEILSECEVTKAVGFEQAKQLLETGDFDIAILDIMGVDGYQLLKIAHEQMVITVMLTAHSLTPEDTIRSYKEGAASFIPKEEMADMPVFLNDVLEAKNKDIDPWQSWYEKFEFYYDKKFSSDWQKKDKEFWEKVIRPHKVKK